MPTASSDVPAYHAALSAATMSTPAVFTLPAFHAAVCAIPSTPAVSTLPPSHAAVSATPSVLVVVNVMVSEDEG